MSLQEVLKSSFTLLRKKPELFLPKILTNLTWSFIWVYFAGIMVDPLKAGLADLRLVSILFLVMVPVNIWVFNSYVQIVDQYREGEIKMFQAFRKGLEKLPQGTASMVLTSSIILLISIPGVFISAYGVLNSSITFQLLGYSWVLASVLIVFVFFYLAPASVVLGQKTFLRTSGTVLKPQVG